MKIPLGDNSPNEDENRLLQKIGLNVEKCEKYYFLEIPEDPLISYTKESPSFEKMKYTVSYKGSKIIDVMQTTLFYNKGVHFEINASVIETALKKEDNSIERDSASLSELTDFQTRLSKCLMQLDNIVYAGGASRGYGRWIEGILIQLQNFKEENTVEHDQLIASDSCYQQLMNKFPNWCDRKNQQARCMQEDAGAEMTLIARNPKDCRIM